MKVELITQERNLKEDGLPKGEYRIGRDYPDHIYLFGPDFNEGIKIGGEHCSVSTIKRRDRDGQIERSHLCIIVNEADVVLRDDGSSYGCYLQGNEFDKTKVSTPGSYQIRLGRHFNFELRLS